MLGEEEVLKIQKTAHLQLFYRYHSYDNQNQPFNSSFIVCFGKRLTPEIPEKINMLANVLRWNVNLALLSQNMACMR